jgi:hypothetical protein
MLQVVAEMQECKNLFGTGRISMWLAPLPLPDVARRTGVVVT